MAESLDPLDVNGRLYRQLARLLDRLESEDEEQGMTTPQLINALIAIGRIQTMFIGMRKEDQDATAAGASVRKFSKAFEANAGGRGKTPARRSRTRALAEATAAADDDEDPNAA